MGLLHPLSCLLSGRVFLGGGHDFLFSLVGASSFKFVCDRRDEGREGGRGGRGSSGS